MQKGSPNDWLFPRPEAPVAHGLQPLAPPSSYPSVLTRSHESRARVERPDTDALIPRPCGQQAVGSKGHAVHGGAVEGQHGQRLHRLPVKHTDAMVPARGGQDPTVWPNLDVGDPGVGEHVSPTHL